MSELKWGIEITVPAKAKGKTKEVLFSDKGSILTFTSRSKAQDHKKDLVGYYSNQVPDPKPRVVRVKVTVSKVKPKPPAPGLQTSL